MEDDLQKKMEDDLQKNGRQPQQKMKMEDDLNKNTNGRLSKIYNYIIGMQHKTLICFITSVICSTSIHRILIHGKDAQEA